MGQPPTAHLLPHSLARHRRQRRPAALRYAVTDLIVDLEAGPVADEGAAVACGLWRAAAELLHALRSAMTGEAERLIRTCDRILRQHGGRLFEGYRVSGLT